MFGNRCTFFVTVLLTQYCARVDITEVQYVLDETVTAL